MQIASRFIASAFGLLCSSSFAFSANVIDYGTLQAALVANDPTLNITVSEIDWPPNAPLAITYPATFTGDATLNGQSQSYLFTLSSTVNFAGNFLLTKGTNGALNRGAILVPLNAICVINGNPTFSGNSSLQKAGVIDVTTGASLTLNGNSIFSNNRAGLSGGAIYLFNSSPTLVINGNPTFMSNTSSTTGGAIQLDTGTVTLTGSPTFMGNSAVTNGGAIYLSTGSVVNINATNASAPVLFQGNTPQDIYLVGTSQLNLNTNPSTIDMQGGVASNNAQPIITKTGPGTWQIGGNSSGYQGTTNVNAGTFQLQPGAVYGRMASGTVTIGPGGTLVFNVGSGSLPLLQAATINLNGTVSVIGAPTGNQMGMVAQAANPISVNGVPAVAESLLSFGAIGPYTWQLAFASPTVLNLIITQQQSKIDDIGGDANDTNIENALSDFDIMTNPGLLAQYILAIERANSQEEAQYLVDALQGETLTGAYELLLNQLITLNVQVDQRLNAPVDTTQEVAMTHQGRMVLASGDKRLPLTYGARAPWVGWGQIIGGMGRQNEVNGSNAYDSRSAGLTAGFDRAFDRNWRLGAALNLQRGILDWDKYGAETRANTLAGLLYGSYDQKAWFAHSLVGGGGSWAKNRRDIPLTALGLGMPSITASSDFTLPFVNARLSSGYHFYNKDVRFTPSAGLFYVHTISDPYSETGADELNLRVAQSDQDNLEAQANIEVLYTTKVNNRPVSLRANYGLGYETLDKQVTITTGFLAFPNLITFDASAVSPGRLRQIAEVGMIVDVAKNVQFRLDYVGVFARHQYNNTGAVGVKWVF